MEEQYQTLYTDKIKKHYENSKKFLNEKQTEGNRMCCFFVTNQLIEQKISQSLFDQFNSNLTDQMKKRLNTMQKLHNQRLNLFRKESQKDMSATLKQGTKTIRSRVNSLGTITRK